MTKVQKVHSLTGRITPALVHDAWRAVRRNRGAAGIDKVSIQMFEANLDQNLDRLMRELKTGAFEPLPARRVYIPKSPGQFRPLGIPAVRDRVAQEVIRHLLSPIFERRFHDDSYGFRPGRSCHQAVERVLELRRQGYDHVLDADISGFFDNLSHRAVMAELSAVIADGNILNLVEKFKTKVRELTRRSHNLDAELVVRLNRLIRGTAHYFATRWSHCGDAYRSLDRWIRMRLRCMKFKRKSVEDNFRVRLKHLERLGLLTLSALIPSRVSGA